MTKIRAERDAIIEALKKRNLDVTATIDEILAKDQQWRGAKTRMESIAAELNKIAKEIGELFRTGKANEAEAAKAMTAELKQEESSLKEEVESLDAAITQLLYQIPNVPNE